MNRLGFCVVAVLLSLCLASPAAAVGPLADPRGQSVRLSGSDVAGAAFAVAGRGIAGIVSRPVIDDSGRELIWKEVRRHVDDRGNVNVFYRQYLVDGNVTAEVHGAEMGVHSLPGGKVWAVNGTQFPRVTVANDPLLDRENAIDAAALGMQRAKQTRVRSLRELPAEQRARSIAATKLMLVERDGVFRYAYFTYANDAQDNAYQVVVDADTEEIVALTSVSKGNNCVPTGSMVTASATAVPVRSGVPTRTAVKAHPANDRPLGIIHEGYWHSTPYKTVFQQVTGTATWMCENISESWTIFPLVTENGAPVYKDHVTTDGRQWRGSAAGDAIYHTDLTMRFFRQMGRYGWDDAYGAAKIIVEAEGIGRDQAQFNSELGNPTAIAPLNSVRIGVPNQMYNLAASLDLVAHEWGHGMIDKTANFPYSGEGAQLHEGFADVIGHMAEKTMQSAGTGLERSDDWTIQEDSAVSGYVRGVIDDAGSHDWVGENGPFFQMINGQKVYGFNDLLHAQDTPTTYATAHSHGNKLSVVYYLLANGGTNPVCNRLWLSGCGTSVPSITLTKANRILFAAIESHAKSYTTWSDLPYRVAEAAFAQYNRCAYDPTANASAEQDAVFAAFTAVGHWVNPVKTNCP